MSEQYTMENPLGGGELVVSAIFGGLGYVAGDMLDRYLATRAGNASTTSASGATVTTTPGAAGSGTLSNAAAIASAPGMMRILAQAGLAAAFTAPAHWVRSPMGRAALQGAGLGVGVRLAGQLIEYYVIQKFFGADSSGNTTAFGSRYFPTEIAATATAAQVAASSSASGMLPVGFGLPFRALPRGIGAGPMNGQGGCGPQSSQTYGGAMREAYNAARQAVCENPPNPPIPINAQPPCGGDSNLGPILNTPMPLPPAPAPAPAPSQPIDYATGISGTRRSRSVYDIFPND